MVTLIGMNCSILRNEEIEASEVKLFPIHTVVGGHVLSILGTMLPVMLVAWPTQKVMLEVYPEHVFDCFNIILLLW